MCIYVQYCMVYIWQPIAQSRIQTITSDSATSKPLTGLVLSTMSQDELKKDWIFRCFPIVYPHTQRALMVRVYIVVRTWGPILVLKHSTQLYMLYYQNETGGPQLVATDTSLTLVVKSPYQNPHG